MKMEPWYSDEATQLYHGNSLQVLRSLPDCSVQCCVTSPPYWGLRDYGHTDQLGLEKTPEEFVAKLVELFREVRRVLRDDGTLWLNIGDSYVAGGKLGKARAGANSTLSGDSEYQDKGRGSILHAGFHEKHRQAGAVDRAWAAAPPGYKQKDLVGVPWLLAFALRADGWYLRSEVIWGKRSPMPESVRDRPTKSHEQVFLLSKSAKYFYDAVGSQEKSTTGDDSASRNMRSVWTLSSYPLRSAHFAAYPPELVRRCLSAGVSEKGCCPQCGKPWVRIVEKKRVATRSGAASKGNGIELKLVNRDKERHCTITTTKGWEPGCNCSTTDQVPCVVLDPFHGAGTTWKVCQRLGLDYIGIELNEEYLTLSQERPEVHFPFERKKSKPRRVRKHVTPLLKGME